MWDPVLSDDGVSALHYCESTRAARHTVKDIPNEPPGGIANRLLVTLLLSLSAPLFLGGLVAAGELGDPRLLGLGTLALVVSGAIAMPAMHSRWAGFFPATSVRSRDVG
jgi:hypothetical protein